MTAARYEGVPAGADSANEILDCLCGKPHPCPDHGAWVGCSYRPTPPRYSTELNGFRLLRLLDESDRRGRYHRDDHDEEAV